MNVKYISSPIFEAIGRIVISTIADRLSEETGQALVGALIDRFGESWMKGQINYFESNVAMADALMNDKLNATTKRETPDAKKGEGK